MQSWNNIIQTAMLGTDKKQLSEQDMPAALSETFRAVSSNPAADKEEQFLQMAAVVSNYRQCGTVPLHKPDLPADVAPAEELPYCGGAAAQLLKAVLDEDNKNLLALWLQLCTGRQQLAPPLWLPQLLNKAKQHRSLAQMVVKAAGNRGSWLGRYNTDWRFAPETVNDEELWQTGTADQRKDVLQRLRTTGPAQAREWLQATWAKENANTKADLLEALSGNLSDDDLEWLESLTGDKSQKVKDAAFALLRRLPSSSVVQAYRQLAQQAVTVKKEKRVLGLSSKNVLQVQLPATYDESIHKTGIEKTISDKRFTNEEWIVYQLISNLPPQSWEAHLNETPENILALFRQDKDIEKYIPALAVAAGRFHDSKWAKLLVKSDIGFYPEIVTLLDPAARETYLLAQMAHTPDAVTDLLTTTGEEWSNEMTLALFRHTAGAPYQYNRSFYNKHIHLVPVSITSTLSSIKPKEGYVQSMWENTADHLTRLLSLKEQIIQSF